MNTSTHANPQLSFATIDAHVQAQSTTPAPAGQTALERLFTRYNAIKPILAALSVIPLIPTAWRAGITAFMTTADDVAVLLAAPITTAPSPLPVNPDFKAGKDQ